MTDRIEHQFEHESNGYAKSTKKVVRRKPNRILLFAFCLTATIGTLMVFSQIFFPARSTAVRTIFVMLGIMFFAETLILGVALFGNKDFIPNMKNRAMGLNRLANGQCTNCGHVLDDCQSKNCHEYGSDKCRRV